MDFTAKKLNQEKKKHDNLNSRHLTCVCRNLLLLLPLYPFTRLCTFDDVLLDFFSFFSLTLHPDESHVIFS